MDAFSDGHTNVFPRRQRSNQTASFKCESGGGERGGGGGSRELRFPGVTPPLQAWASFSSVGWPPH